MIESPWLQEVLEEHDTVRRRGDIEKFLTQRFGSVPADVKARLQTITDPNQLVELIRLSIVCSDLDGFRANL